MDAQAKAMQEQAQAMKEQTEATKQSQQEFKDALESGLKDMGSTFTDAFSETAKETKRSTRVIAFSIIGIASNPDFLLSFTFILNNSLSNNNLISMPAPT